MAIEKTINIDVNSKNATKGVDELGKSVEDLNSSLNETEKADVSIEKIGKRHTTKTTLQKQFLELPRTMSGS